MNGQWKLKIEIECEVIEIDFFCETDLALEHRSKRNKIEEDSKIKSQPLGRFHARSGMLCHLFHVEVRLYNKDFMSTIAKTSKEHES